MMRRDAWREYSRGSLWLMPVVAVVLSIGLGAGLSQIDVGPDSPLAFQGTADDARSLLIDITSTMVTVIALVLGLAVVALQLSSTQFSPRLLRNFLRDRPNQVVLSVFVGTFGYSAAGLFVVGVAGGERVDEFPRFAVTVAIVLLFVSLALLVFFADHLAHSIQVDRIIGVVERATLRVIAELPVAVEPAPAAPPGAATVAATSSGYVQVVRTERLLAAATARRVNIRLRPRVGEHVVSGSTLAWVWPASTADPPPSVTDLTAVVDDAVRIGFERTEEQDPGLGMRQLCDTACKALSPAVNDPYTAIQAGEHLAVLFAALAGRPVGDHVVRDRERSVLVAVPARSFPDYLALYVGLIRRFGASEPTVIAAMLRLLATTVEAMSAEPDRWAAVENEANLLVTAAERSVVEPVDLQQVHHERAALEHLLLRRRTALFEASG
jgi:uncharacterized membrane protein